MARQKLDVEQIFMLAQISCSYDEMSKILKCHQSTLTKSKRYSQAIQAGRAAGNASLRRKQYEMALAGSTTMLIWLGKQRLEQRDQVDIKTQQTYVFEVETSKGEKTVMGILPSGSERPAIEVN